MRSGFIQLIIKTRLAGKPLPLSISPKKYQPIDSFKKYLTNILPKIEETVEIELLKGNLVKLQSPLVRKQLITAYLRRLFRLRLYEQQQIKSYKQLSQISPQQSTTITDPTTLKQINEHTSYDVGSYILFSKQQFKTVFLGKPFGVYMKEYQVSGKFSLMVRREGLGIVGVMKLMQEKGVGDGVDWGRVYAMSKAERAEYINHQQHYPIMFQQLSNHLYQQVQTYRHQEFYMRVWGNSVISDILVNSILQNLPLVDTCDVFGMAAQAIKFITQLDIQPSACDFSRRFKSLPLNPPLTIFTTVPYFSSFYYTTPSFKSIFLGGLAGTGKSTILSYLAMFAFKNNWLIITVTDGYKWINDRQVKPVKMFNGLFVIEEHVLEWLERFKSVNEKLLGGVSLNKHIYGRLDLTGVDQTQYQPVPNIYYQGRQTYFNDIDYKYKTRIQNQMDTRPKWRLTDLLPNPTSILEIINTGLLNPPYSTCAMGELLRQVYASDHLILELVDDYSWFFRRTVYRHFKYYNDNQLFGAIPAYHIAHCRFFIGLDGNKIKRGLKVVASSNHGLWKHQFDITQIMLPKQYEHRVPNLTPSQFQKAGRYNILTNYWRADDVLRKNIQYMFAICQGNWVDFQRTAMLGHYY